MSRSPHSPCLPPPCRTGSTPPSALSHLPTGLPPVPEPLAPDPSGHVVITMLHLASQAALFFPFLSCSLWFLPLLPLLTLTLFLNHIDHLRWASLVWKNKGSNNLLPLCPLLFIPGNKDMLQEPLLGAGGIKEDTPVSFVPFYSPHPLLKFLPHHWSVGGIFVFQSPEWEGHRGQFHDGWDSTMWLNLICRL